MDKKLQIAIIGSAGEEDYGSASGVPHTALNALAEEVGRAVAKAGAIVVTGGTDGIMEFAAKGAKEAGGITVGVVKGDKHGRANEWTDVEVVTGMLVGGSEFLIPMMVDGLIVIGGGAGTLQEIAMAYRNKRPIVSLVDSRIRGWGVTLAGQFLDERHSVRIQPASTPHEAVAQLLQAVQENVAT